MAGHSQFKNIMHRKGRQDAKRAKIFTKLAREITVSAKIGGPDPLMNARLRGAIVAARSQNMPKENIQRSINKASVDGDASFEEVRYEGYGPSGVAVIVEALTDNRNRTASEVRAAFTKHGGNLGETGSVSFMFERVGIINYLGNVADADDIFEAALESGAQDVLSSKDNHEIICAPDDFNYVRQVLVERFGEPETGMLDWKAQNNVSLDEGSASTLIKMLDSLEDNDDVQRVAANFDITEEVMERLSAS